MTELGGPDDVELQATVARIRRIRRRNRLAMAAAMAVTFVSEGCALALFLWLELRSGKAAVALLAAGIAPGALIYKYLESKEDIHEI